GLRASQQAAIVQLLSRKPPFHALELSGASLPVLHCMLIGKAKPPCRLSRPDRLRDSGEYSCRGDAPSGRKLSPIALTGTLRALKPRTDQHLPSRRCAARALCVVSSFARLPARSAPEQRPFLLSSWSAPE